MAKGRFTLDTKTAIAEIIFCLRTVTKRRSIHQPMRDHFNSEWKEGKFKGEHKLFLIDGASRSWELGYREELEKLAAEFSWLTYVPTARAVRP